MAGVLAVVKPPPPAGAPGPDPPQATSGPLVTSQIATWGLSVAIAGSKLPVTLGCVTMGGRNEKADPLATRDCELAAGTRLTPVTRSLEAHPATPVARMRRAGRPRPAGGGGAAGPYRPATGEGRQRCCASRARAT